MHFVSAELQWDLNTPLGLDLGATREARPERRPANTWANGG